MAAHDARGAHAAGLAALQPAPAPAAGLTTPQKNEAPGWQAEGDEGNTGQARDSAHHATSTQLADKAFSTLRARLALAGHALHRTASGDGQVRYFVGRWGAVRELTDLAAVAKFADLVTGGGQCPT